jgi:hypothetical protein
MNPAWNLVFALLLAVGIWCRLRAPELLCRALGPLLLFFGVNGVPVGRALGDLFGIAGVLGLLFVAWSDRIMIGHDLMLGIDTLVTSLGLGLAGAWVFARAEQTSTVEDLLEEAEWDQSRGTPPRSGGSLGAAPATGKSMTPGKLPPPQTPE